MQYTETFPAFRADEIPVSLVIPCISGTPLNQGPQNWEIPLQFVPGAPPTPTPIPTMVFTGKACLDRATLQAALDGPPTTLPAGLGGRMVFWRSNNDFGEMVLSNLDGNNRVSLGAGIFPTLSPDGKSLVYRGSDSGLHIRNITRGGDFVVPGSIQPKVNNNNPVWSPDGQEIAISRFANDNSDVYLVNADGSNLRGLVTSPKQESFLGWAPDSRSVSYTTYEKEIHHIFVIDLQSGTSREIGTLPPGTTMFSLAPDGKRIIFGNGQGIFIANTSDFKPALLFNSSLNLGMPLVWSPDSQWLALGYWGEDGHGPVRMVVLQPDTCQFFPLQGLGEILSSWVR
jgi:Tol biopolymer transport system component